MTAPREGMEQDKMKRLEQWLDAVTDAVLERTDKDSRHYDSIIEARSLYWEAARQPGVTTP